MTLFLLCVGYVVVHLSIYVLLIDKRNVRELTILLYHLASFIALAVALSLALVGRGFPDEIVAAAVAGLALHALYSLSFLELWALADGSLSLPILVDFAGAAPLTHEQVLDKYIQTGDTKKVSRADTLIALRLVRRDGVEYRLTVLGRAAACFFALMLLLAGIRERG